MMQYICVSVNMLFKYVHIVYHISNKQTKKQKQITYKVLVKDWRFLFQILHS